MVTRKSCALREEQGNAPPMKSRRRNEKTGMTCFFMSKKLLLLDHGYHLTNVPQKLISASRIRGGRVGLKCSRLLNRIYLTVVSGLANPFATNSNSMPLSDSAMSSPVGGCQGVAIPFPDGCTHTNLPRSVQLLSKLPSGLGSNDP